MALVPFKRENRNPLARLQNEVDDLFDSFFRWHDGPFLARRTWPAIDVAQTDEAIVVRAELPGCKAEDVDISVYGNTLVISGEKKESKEEKEKGYYHMETSYGEFRREIGLPADVDTEKVEAVCKDGILSITMPKLEKAKAVKVKVQG